MLTTALAVIDFRIKSFTTTSSLIYKQGSTAFIYIDIYEKSNEYIENLEIEPWIKACYLNNINPSSSSLPTKKD